MQQIFAQKLRFDFSDEWKIVKLESLIKKGKAGGTPSSTNSEYYNGDIPFLSIRDMTEQGKYIVKTEKSITEEGLNNSSAWIIPKNSLLYSIYASIGLVAINRSDISTSQAIYGIILKDGVSLEYMYYYLTYFKKNVHKYIETGTQGNLNAKLLKSFEILLPSLEEQEMNVNILSLVDEKIENSKKEIEKINEFKKGLLQQMFIMANFI
ncbi:MAG: restriction endonuclease subunit S [Clostridia bacterium]|nr:restriction endonuclease subunit S [Clostridia bacterium]